MKILLGVKSLVVIRLSWIVVMSYLLIIIIMSLTAKRVGYSFWLMLFDKLFIQRFISGPI